MMFPRLVVLIAILLSVPLAAEEVSVQTSAGILFGTFELPSSSSPIPVVLIIAGSGPTDRDGNSELISGGNDSLKMLAEALAARGIASLRYDKRGVGASRAAALPERDLRFEMFVDDAVAWAARLFADERFSELILAGHSEGSLIAILAAQRFPASRVVSLAGPGRPAADVLLEQLEAANLSPALMQRAREIIAELRAGNEVASIPLDLAALFRPSVQPYLISWFRYDPAAEIAKLVVPVLIVQGTTDIQVSVADAHLLASGANAGWVTIVEGMNHILKDVPPNPAAQVASYSDPSLPVNTTVVESIARFLQPVSRRRSVR